MKNILFTILLLSSIFISSCNDWLDVKPRTEMEKDDMLTTENGYKDALSGVYILLLDENAYGNKLSFGFIEKLASLYDYTSASVGQKISMHQYSDANVEAQIKTIYNKLYHIIANTNLILENIDSDKDIFTENGLFELIKAEASAIRAMCHFDLLRLFGPIPTEINESKKYLAYVTEYGRQRNEHITYNEYCKLLLQDLNDAEVLFKKDPIIGGIQSSTFMSNRQYRLNYYAVKALQARVNLWMGNNSDAYEAAKVVVGTDDNLSKYSLNYDFQIENNPEYIFGLYDFSLQKKYESNFLNGNLKKGTSESTIKKNLYGNTGTDVRELNWFEQILLADASKCYICKKYSSTEEITPNIIPIIRLSEMYFILVETAPLEEAQEYFDKFKKSRNIETPILSDENRISELLKEYRRKFYSEGYTFYFYKRNNISKSDILWADRNMIEPNYIIPLPDTELIYEQ